MDGWLAKAGAFLTGLAKWVWPYMEKALYFLAGREWEQKVQEVNDAKARANNAEKYAEVARLNGRRPVDGAASRLRKAASRNKKQERL